MEGKNRNGQRLFVPKSLTFSETKGKLDMPQPTDVATTFH